MVLWDLMGSGCIGSELKMMAIILGTWCWSVVIRKRDACIELTVISKVRSSWLLKRARKLLSKSRSITPGISLAGGIGVQRISYRISWDSLLIRQKHIAKIFHWNRIQHAQIWLHYNTPNNDCTHSAVCLNVMAVECNQKNGFYFSSVQCGL